MKKSKLQILATIISISIPIITLICVLVIVYKELIYKNKVDNYEDYFITIDHKLSDKTEINYEERFKDKDYKSIQVKEYLECLNKELTYDELNDKSKDIINKLEVLYNSSYDHFAFKYVDIYTGFSVSYNENQEIFTASTIKAPMAIYIYEQAEQGNIDLDKKITYTPAYYNTGSGILKNTEFNKSYTTRELISYAIKYSDNAAHNMLMDTYGRENMYNFWSNNFNTKAIFKYNNNWGVITAKDATIYMTELYNYYSKNTTLSNELAEVFKNVTFKIITNKNMEYNTMNKSGWTGSVFHDVAVVLEDNPYVLAVLTNLGQNYSYLINQTSVLVGNLHDEYWNIKYNECNKIINK